MNDRKILLSTDSWRRWSCVKMTDFITLPSTEILTYWLSAYIFLNINGKRGLKYSLRLKNFLNKIPSLSTYYHNVSCIIYLIFHIFHILILRGVLVLHCSNYFSSLSSSTFFFPKCTCLKNEPLTSCITKRNGPK